MKLPEWFKKTTADERRQVARMAGCSPYYIYIVVRDGCSPGLARKLEKAIGKLTPDKIVTKEEIRPDIWKSQQ